MRTPPPNLNRIQKTNTLMKSPTLIELEAANKQLEKVTTAESRQQTTAENLNSEISSLADRHRQASLAAALAGKTAPATPARIIEAKIELDTATAVLADLRQRAEQARQAVQDAEQEHTASRRKVIIEEIEKAAQGHFKTIAEAYVTLIEVSGAEGWHRVKDLINNTLLFPDRDPVTRALAAEGLTHGEGDQFSVLPEGTFVMDWTDRAFAAHNLEPAPAEITNRL